MTTPALQAHIDQHAAWVRDWLASVGVELNDPVQMRALRAAYLLFAAGVQGNAVDVCLVAFGDAIQP